MSVKPVRFGSETPRIFTPPLRELVPEVVDEDGNVVQGATTLGFEFCEFADSIGVDLFPWERWLALHALELRADGMLRFRTVILLVARQNGKTTVLKLLALFWMYVLGRQLVIGTAQNLDIAEETWQDTLNLAEAVEELAAEIEHVVRQSGKKAMLLKSGERYRVAPSSRGGGRGLSGDLVEMDELREHRDWASWAAVTNTTMAIQSALVVAASNAGDLLSVVLRMLRFMCMADPRTVGVTEEELTAFGLLPESDPAADDVVVDSVGIFEWSAGHRRSVWDRDGWAEANPSMGHHPEMESALASTAKIASAGGEAEWVFRTENLCQWRPTGGAGPFPSGAWEAGSDPKSDLAVAVDSPIGICVDVSADRGMAYVSMAALRVDGHVHVQVLAQRAGVEWVIPWLISSDRRTRDRWVGVTWQLNGAPVSSLTDELRETGLPLVDWSGADLSRAHGIAYDLVRLDEPVKPDDDGQPELETVTGEKQRLYHLPQPVLDLPAGSASVSTLSGAAWVIDRRKSVHDAAPLIAAIGAVWVLLRPEDKPKRIPMVHEWPSEEVMRGWAESGDVGLVPS